MRRELADLLHRQPQEGCPPRAEERGLEASGPREHGHDAEARAGDVARLVLQHEADQLPAGRVEAGRLERGLEDGGRQRLGEVGGDDPALDLQRPARRELHQHVDVPPARGPGAELLEVAPEDEEVLRLVVTLGRVVGHHRRLAEAVRRPVHQALDDLEPLPLPRVERVEDLDPGVADGPDLHRSAPVDGGLGVPVRGEGEAREPVPGGGVGTTGGAGRTG